MRFVRTISDGLPHELGGKAAALAELGGSATLIPAWFVVTPEAFDASLTPSMLRAFRTASPEQLPALIKDVQPAPSVLAEIHAALNRLCPDGRLVAVRSSAIDEDGMEQSFAGQLASYLSIAPDAVGERVAAVWRSGLSDRVLAYRRAHGLPDAPPVPAVLVQRMVAAEAAGIAFGADPVSGRRGVAVVAAVRGLGDRLVDGDSNADTFHVGRNGAITLRTLADTDAAISDQQVQAVAELARRVSRDAGRPQDIEWAIENGQLFLLQARPISTLPAQPDPDGRRAIWDNSNIVESYGGITTPLTFSFARGVYSEVYRQLCRLLGVSATTIDNNAQIFDSTLGLIQGRIYYNMLSWYGMLALLPGFAANRRFMEQMMGVSEGLPSEIAATLEQTTSRQRLADRLRLGRTVLGLLRSYLTLEQRKRDFVARLDNALRQPTVGFDQLRPDELVACYRDLQRQLLRHWDAPLINDFFCMIFFGLLRKLVVAWCGSDGLQNDLLRQQGAIISAEPARRMRELAALARMNPAFAALLRDGSQEQIIESIASQSAFREQYDAYLARFGDRCLDELKLESATLEDEPLPLFRSIGQLAAREQAEVSAPADDTAERRAWAAIGAHPLRRLVFGWVLRNARVRVRDRENLRFERTRLFGRVRRIFVELGRRFAALDLLDDPRDIFFLEVEEALGFVEGIATTTDLRGLVRVRRAEHERISNQPPPASRFDTHGIVHHGNQFTSNAATTVSDGQHLQGLGCCPGVVRGSVRVITDPRGAQIAPGEILVAERMDPGWITLLPAAAGVLVERGSLLSHAAIVARELGIPTIVSLPGVTNWLHDGELVELDGGNGIVRLVEGSVNNEQR